MRSSDLAQLAGVSVRTLRHYHQIGLLPEPPRSMNGYRLYAAADLVRVLRVRQLAELGVPLSRIEPSVDVNEELDLLDRRYAQQIEDLQSRRRTIRELREQDMQAGTPALATPYMSALSDRDDVSARSAEIERDAAIMLSHLGAKGASTNTEATPAPDVRRLSDAAAALNGLADDADEEQIDAAAQALIQAIEEIGPVFRTRQLTQAVESSLDDYVSEHLTGVQLEAVRRAFGRTGASGLRVGGVL